MNRKATELKKIIDEIDEIRKLHWKTPNENIWISKVLRFLKKEFEEDSDYYKQFYNKTHAGVFAISENTPDSYFQESKDERLEEYKLLLKSFLDEIKNLQEEQQDNSSVKKSETTKRLSELQSKIEEAKLEAERRKAVVESKRYGAEIEIITMLRDELKRKDETALAISELGVRLAQIEEKLSKSSTQQESGHEEDKLYDEIMENTQGDTDLNTRELVASARQDCAEIKGLRDEIAILQNQSSLTSNNVFEKNRLEKISEKSERITKLLKGLAEIWGLFVS